MSAFDKYVFHDTSDFGHSSLLYCIPPVLSTLFYLFPVTLPYNPHSLSHWQTACTRRSHIPYNRSPPHILSYSLTPFLSVPQRTCVLLREYHLWSPLFGTLSSIDKSNEADHGKSTHYKVDASHIPIYQHHIFRRSPAPSQLFSLPAPGSPPDTSFWIPDTSGRFPVFCPESDSRQRFPLTDNQD